ncbi:MAG: hypothetical protein GWM90_04630 [Gemmatimonadetes bacterium]|nr:hypothetical protein [Gemmatimonadota bacterium]NIQ52978.1 hypothetical protein [Gemmatimonadota bacterium]NIU78679.1 hypothetical protein [Gammaproteobacteria bacterium]NIX43427.1 hypothetical protein [Gemmatimonadota bacterium]NIY11883.1 hypothetical protein [Gemmatimonadota bacterium]
MAAPALLLAALLPALAAAQTRDQMVAEALSAAPATVAVHATVMDWEQNVLREGTNGWTCFPSPPSIGNAPMCFDEPWLEWAHAWMNQQPVAVDRVGVSYMLQGDDGSSNTDPFAEGPTADNHWVVEGPHIMVIVPDVAALEGLPTDPSAGGPYVMWKGTPYAHVMIPVH